MPGPTIEEYLAIYGALTGGFGVFNSTLLKQTRIISERCFSRVFTGLHPTGNIQFRGINDKFTIKLPQKHTARTLMEACRDNPGAKEYLSWLPIMNKPSNPNADYELYLALQDLADIIAWEATNAFTEAYFPAPMNVEPLSEDHVKELMIGMQREMDREGFARSKSASDFADLSWERQVSLAERRRMWFRVYGITPQSWRTGFWNLWAISDETLPTGPDYTNF